MNDARICPSCGGTLDDRSIQIDFRSKGRLIVVEGIPAQVCKDCGEQLVSASTSKDVLTEDEHFTQVGMGSRP